MRIAAVFFLIIISLPILAADAVELSPELWTRVRAVGAQATEIPPPSAARAPDRVSLADCLAFAFQCNAGFRDSQKELINTRGKLWVAEQRVFHTISNRLEYDRETAGSTDRTLTSSYETRWEMIDGSSIRAGIGAGTSNAFDDIFTKRPSVSATYERPLYRGAGAVSTTAERIRGAQTALATRELTYYDAYQALAQRVVEDYCAALLARGEVEIAERAVDRAKRLYDINYAKFTGEGIVLPGETWVSQVAEIDVDQAKLSWERTRQQLISRRQTYQDTLDRLLLTMGVTPGAAPELTTAITYTPRDYEETALVQTALTHSTELGRLRTEWDDAEAALRIARDKRLPNVIASVGVEDLGNTSTASTRTGWVAGVRVEVPIRSRAQTEDVEREERALRVLEQRIVAARDSVTQEVQRQVRAANSTRQRIEIGELTLALARKSREAAQGMYDEGLSDYLRVLNAEDRLVDAERSLLQEQVQYFLTTVRVRRALGENIAQALTGD